MRSRTRMNAIIIALLVSLPASIFAQTVSVADFGALANDYRDDTAAIQSAIEKMYAAGGGTVTFPAGTFLLALDQTDRFRPALTLRAGVALKGAGRDRTTLKLVDQQGNYAFLLTAANDNPDTPMRDEEDLSGFKLLDLTIDANASKNVHAGPPDLADHLTRTVLLITKGKGIEVSRCRFINTNGQWVTLFGGNLDRPELVSDVVLADNLFEQIGGHAKADYDMSAVYTSADHVRIVRNTFRSVGRAKPGTRTAIEIHGSEYEVAENVFEDFFTAVNVTGELGRVSKEQRYEGNTVRGAAVGFMLWSIKHEAIKGPPLQQVSIRNNAIAIDIAGWKDFKAHGFDIRPFQRGGISGVAGDADIDGLTIEGNTITFLSSSSDTLESDERSAGITFDAPVMLRNIKIARNIIEHPPGAGVFLRSSLEAATIEGNQVKNPGSSNLKLAAEVRSGIYLAEGSNQEGSMVRTTMRRVTITGNRVTDTRRPSPTHAVVTNANKNLGMNAFKDNSGKAAGSSVIRGYLAPSKHRSR